MSVTRTIFSDFTNSPFTYLDDETTDDNIVSDAEFGNMIAHELNHLSPALVNSEGDDSDYKKSPASTPKSIEQDFYGDDCGRRAEAWIQYHEQFCYVCKVYERYNFPRTAIFVRMVQES